jgi:hypothetical protein
MILTIDDAIKNVDGYFYLYHYSCIVKRIAGTEHFGCFKDNDLQEVTVPCIIFCHSDKDFDYFMGECNRKSNGLLKMYSYVGHGRVGSIDKIYYGHEAVRYIYEVHNFKYLAHLVEIGSREYIQ